MVHADLASITTSKASATEKADAKAIEEIIKQLPNGFQTLDDIVHEKMKALIVDTLAGHEGMSRIEESGVLCQEISTQTD